MSEAQREAQQSRRQREREAVSGSAEAKAAAAANRAAAKAPDGPLDFQPDPNAAADAFAQRKDDPPREFKRGNPTRDAAYEQIMASRQQQSEDAVREEPRPEPEQPAQTPKVVAPQPAAAQVAEPAPAPEPPKAETIEMVTVKIDGQESQVPKAEVDAVGGLAPYQMLKAAEKRFEEGKRFSTDAQALFEKAQRAAAPPKPPEPSLAEQMKAYVERIQLGTPEDGAAALAEAIQRAVPRPTDQRQAAAEALLLFQVSQAEEAFIRTNQDILANPMLKNLVIMEKGRRLEDLRKQNRLPDDWNQFYTSIAVDVRTAIGRPPTTGTPPPTSAAQPTSGMAEKEARKASISVLPTAAARAAPPEEDKPLTRDDILARARKSRGQPL